MGYLMGHLVSQTSKHSFIIEQIFHSFIIKNNVVIIILVYKHLSVLNYFLGEVLKSEIPRSKGFKEYGSYYQFVF